MVSRRMAALGAMLAVLFMSLPARAGDAESDFFKGKTVRLIVGFGAGGGYDTYARMIAPYIGRRLGANVVVENQPGAGSLIALNNLVVSEPDGLRLMLANGTAAGLSQLLGMPGVRFDLNTVTHFGTVSASPWIWLVHKDSPIKTVADAQKAQNVMTWSATGPIDGMSDGAQVACAVLQLRCKVILGYTGTNDATLAVARKEIDSAYVSDTSANNYVHAHDVRAVANMSRRRSRFFPDIPTVFEQTNMSKEDQAIMDIHATAEDLGRILIGPPKMPPARAAFLRRVIADALNDPKLKEEGERTQRYIEFIDADRTQKSVHAAITNLSPEQKKKIQSIINYSK
jgi:tripartite-type tricarboxylate transporter receptor subunit TctC